VYRALAIANDLAEHGHRVTVITVDADFFETVTGTDTSLLTSIHPSVQVERVPLPHGHFAHDVRDFGRFQANFPWAFARLREFSQRRLFPERYNSWIPGAVRRALTVHRHNSVDVTVATGNPWSAFAAAWWLRKLGRVPYVMDYRDAWTLNPYTGQDTYPPGHLAWRWERRLIKSAARVAFVNGPTMRWYAEHYPAAASRMIMVMNGYDPELLGPMQPQPPPVQATLRFGFVGTLTEQQPHEALWKGWQQARSSADVRDATMHIYGHLGFFHGGRATVEALLPDPATSGVHYEGPVSKAAVGAVYRSLDVLVLMVAPSPYNTPGKVFEYAATGKPIVSVHSPETGSSDVLRGYPLWFPVNELTADEVATALTKAAHRARTINDTDTHACLDYARTLRRDLQLDILREALAAVA
jgi:glycosyltransferase involved in cell wall biosynthesis